MKRPDEDWLIIHHKGEVERDLKDYLPADVLDHRVRFLHWGNHYGTNAFADDVIAAGRVEVINLDRWVSQFLNRR